MPECDDVLSQGLCFLHPFNQYIIFITAAIAAIAAGAVAAASWASTADLPSRSHVMGRGAEPTRGCHPAKREKSLHLADD